MNKRQRKKRLKLRPPQSLAAENWKNTVEMYEYLKRKIFMDMIATNNVIVED